MKKGFDCVFDSNSKLLILGSFPSVLSFEEGFYYGNPRNRFWNIMQKVFNEKLLTVNDKINFLHKYHIALWDIVLEGENENNGKLSSSDNTLQCFKVADIDWLLNDTHIDKILCNGKKCYSLFCKNYPHLVKIANCMPSTSPANIRFDEKIWLDELEQLIK